MLRFLLSVLTLALWVVLAYADQGTKKNEKAQGPPVVARLLQGTPEDFIKRFDKNKDGYLSKDELPGRLQPFFDQADKNDDGKLDKREVAAMLQSLRKRFGQAANKTGSQPDIERVVAGFLQRMDTNKDGKISRDEAKGMLAQTFDQLDANKDGYLDKSELRKAAERLLAVRKAAPSPEAARRVARPESSKGVAPPLDFDALDRNADGRLSREELKGTPLAEQFDAIDTNKDGKIDPKEWAAFLKSERAAQGVEPKK